MAEQLKRKPQIATKKTTSNNLRYTTKSGTFWKPQKRLSDGSLETSNKVSNGVLPKINQLLLTDDYRAITVDVTRVKLIDGKMYGRAFCKESGKMRNCRQTGVGSTWKWC